MNAPVLVIGGGPAGATAALVLAREGRPVGLVDPLGVGGQLVNVEHLPDFPGFPGGVAGWDLAASLGEQVLDAGVELVLGRAAWIRLEPGGRWRVAVDGTEREAAAVLVAAGCRPHPLPGSTGLEGRGLSYCAACDGGLFAGKDVLVVGGGDLAMAEACSLAPLAARVTILFAGSEPTAGAAWRAAAASHPNVALLPRALVMAVREEAGSVTGLTVVDEASGQTRQVDGAGVFGALHGVPNSELVATFTELDPDGGVRTGPGYAVAGSPGLFAAGDVRARSARRAAVAAGEGAAAALALSAHLGGHAGEVWG